MTRINQTDAAQAPKPRAAAAAPKPAEAQPAMPSLDGDFFARNAPSAEAVAKAEKAVAALGTLPGVPLSNKAKAEWLKDARAKYEAASAGLETLRDAEWAGKYPQAKLDVASKAVSDASEKLYTVEERAGLKPMPKPLNPFRPLMENTNGLGSHLPKNALGGIIAAIGLPVAIAVDMADIATRPLQAAWWPVGMTINGARKVGQMVGIG